MDYKAFYSKIYLYFEECYEKEYFIPTFIFYILLIGGLIVGIYNKLAVVAIMYSIYNLAKREGKKEGFFEGFREYESLEESKYENKTTVYQEMDKVIEYYRNKRK